MEKEKLGIALVGLGQYSTEQLAPALQETKHCRLSGIVTGNTSKAEEWKKKYRIPEENIYHYNNFDEIKNNKDIDVVYIVLPNSMHAEYAIRAARAGKHVICEKPMAVNVQECEAMIQACAEAGVHLSVGYRLHYEPYNQAMADLHKNGTIGTIKKVKGENGFEIEPGVWRLNKALSGGGPLMDLGIYCVQGAIYTVGEDPIAVTAKEEPKTDNEKFKEVEQALSWTMEFPGGAVAECTTSYAKGMNLLRAEGDKGWMELAPSYEYEGLKAKKNDGDVHMPKINQQAAQMDGIALSILRNEKSKVPGEMGLRDVKILMAIYEAMQTGKRIPIN